jgi:hypothetical protein
MRLVLSLLVFSEGVDGFEDSGINPRSASEPIKSLRSVVMSRTVFGEMKFYENRDDAFR